MEFNRAVKRHKILWISILVALVIVNLILDHIMTDGNLLIRTVLNLLIVIIIFIAYRMVITFIKR